jgi:hypothetical protein
MGNSISHDDGVVAHWKPFDQPVGPSLDVMPCGCSGTLYPPRSFHPMVLDRAFLKLCPTGDDIWYYWMLRKAGTKVKTAGWRRSVITWRGTQGSALSNENNGGRNDVMIARLAAAIPIGAAE